MLVKAETYLDSNAGAPLKLSVREALLPFLRDEHSVIIPNPSSIHAHGRLAKRVVAESRERIALSLGRNTDSEQIIFTSSGSEANQLCIRSVFEPRLKQGKSCHWITTPVEHDSNLQMVAWLMDQGGSVSYLPVDAQGVTQVEAVQDLTRPDTALVSVVWANNETGIVTDVHQLAQFTQSLGIPLHLDAIQAWGKLPIDVGTLGAQMLTLSGHKIGGLAGTGAVWLARGHSIQSVILGKQEKGRRGGTENLLGILAMGAAAQSLQPIEWAARVAPVRDRLEREICARLSGVTVNGVSAARVANTLNLTFSGVEGDGLVMALDLAGYSVSSGSACSSGVLEPSHVLLAMGLSRLQAMAAVRVSLADVHDWDVLEGFITALEKAVGRIRLAKRFAT